MYTLYEHLLSNNSFNRPKVLENQDATYVLIIRLLLLEPGTIQSHPEMGIGIVSRYLYADMVNIDTLRQETSDQIAKYLPMLIATDINIVDENKTLLIIITANGTAYNVSFSKETYQLQDL